MTLNVSLPRLDSDLLVTGPDGAAATLPATPGELVVPLGWLSYAADGLVPARAGDGTLVRVLPGATMLTVAAK